MKVSKMGRERKRNEEGKKSKEQEEGRGWGLKD